LREKRKWRERHHGEEKMLETGTERHDGLLDVGKGIDTATQEERGISIHQREESRFVKRSFWLFLD
jgi:hypothetical protein